MSLKNLLALQAKAQDSVRPAGGNLPPAPASPESESPAAEGDGIATPTPDKPKGLGLNVVKTGVAKPAAPVPAKKPDASPEVFSLADLAATSTEALPESEPTRYADFEFDDEIEATAPDRDLSPEMTAEQLQFVESLDAVYQILHDPEMFGQTVRIIMTELQENKEYAKLLSDSDVHVMIRGMRRTMGLARVRKQEKTRGAKTKANARTKAGVSDDAMKLLNQLMGGSDD